LTWARHLTDGFLLGWTCQGLSITVEAAARVGQVDLAQAWLAQLAERAAATATPWALGQLARSRALLAPDEAAETLYQQALAELARTSVATETAHTHLVYGEWLRRQNRRADARRTLGIAHEMFSSMGADAFARRADVELAAIGERVRRRSTESQAGLTPQEFQVARLASSGATNSEIAARLFHQREHGRLPPPQGVPEARHLVAARPGDGTARRGPAAASLSRARGVGPPA